MSGNPKRGCGKKKKDSFYLESEMGEGGLMKPWVWALGDGVDDVVSIEFPPRNMTVINPVATLLEGEIVLADEPTDRFKGGDKNSLLYQYLVFKLRPVGIGDHVGSAHYTPMQFVREIQAHGPSRRISQKNAEAYALLLKNLGPLPVLFTHSGIPVFGDEGTRDEAIELLSGVRWMISDETRYISTWRMNDWGTYAREDHTDGSDQYMVAILDALHDLKAGKKGEFGESGVEAWDRFDSFLKQRATFTEQPFGLSWFTHITYTVPEDGAISESILDIPGIQVLDLSEEEEFVDEPE